MVRAPIALLAGVILAASVVVSDKRAARQGLKVGVAAVAITPFGPNADWDGGITASGVWGEKFTDTNHSGRWDVGEPFEDDPRNTAIDQDSKGKYDGIYLAGFGQNRPATARRDDIWARAIVIEYETTRIAIVSIDVIGYYSKANYYGLAEVQKLVDRKLGINEILISSTHNHEAPDTIGPWGVNTLSDGKYPRYLRFVDRQIAKAITRAAASTTRAVMKLGRTDPRTSPSIAGMQTRTHGRPPHFYDEELRVIQFFNGAGSTLDRVIATLINWNTHPESMENRNTAITSDFPHALRETIEKKYGGAAIYISGDLGAVEIIGDSNNKRSDRTRFDGKDFPLKPETNRPDYTFERTDAIGRDTAKAVVDALDRGEWSTEKHKRDDCPEADTKRPLEPSVRDRMRKKYKFVFGLCPDEFGYIVPGYDYLAPSPDPARGLRETEDPCKSKGIPNHYHETNSASSVLGARWACVAAALFEGKAPDVEACPERRASVSKTPNSPTQKQK